MRRVSTVGMKRGWFKMVNGAPRGGAERFSVSVRHALTLGQERKREQKALFLQLSASIHRISFPFHRFSRCVQSVLASPS